MEDFVRSSHFQPLMAAMYQLLAMDWDWRMSLSSESGFSHGMLHYSPEFSLPFHRSIGESRRLQCQVSIRAHKAQSPFPISISFSFSSSEFFLHWLQYLIANVTLGQYPHA